MTSTVLGPADLPALKVRQQQMWASGDYATVAARVVPLGEELCEAADIRSGERVLDVACGTGNAAIAAARRFAHVTGVDYVPSFLERAAARAASEGVEADFRHGDAEELPFEDGTFDVVLSAIGAMFAPDQERTADELVRVCRPGGRIALANWAHDGFLGDLLRTVGRRLPPPPGTRPPTVWGSEERINELFGGRGVIRTERRTLFMHFSSAGSYLDFMSRNYGPLCAALTAVGDGRDDLVAELREVVERYDRGTDGTLKLAAAWLAVVVEPR